jgi:drug/metabolite transporter (DMT)-like permease
MSTPPDRQRSGQPEVEYSPFVTAPPTRLRKTAAMITGWFWEPAGDPAQPPVLRRWAVYPLLALAIIALGINWPFITIGLREVSSLWLTAFRVVGSTLLVVAIAASRGRLQLPPVPDRPLVVIVGLLRLTAVTAMALLALQLVPPGRSSILIYTSSLWVVPIATLLLKERLTVYGAIGLAIGVTGLIVLLDPRRIDWMDTENLIGHGLLLGAAVITAYVVVRIRGHRWTASPLDLMPWQLMVACLPVLALALVFDGAPTFDWSTTTLLIVIYQATIATPFTFWGIQTVLRRAPAIPTNLALNAVPVVGVIAAAFLVGEELTIRSAVALVLLITGVWIGVGLGTRRTRGTQSSG